LETIISEKKIAFEDSVS